MCVYVSVFFGTLWLIKSSKALQPRPLSLETLTHTHANTVVNLYQRWHNDFYKLYKLASEIKT